MQLGNVKLYWQKEKEHSDFIMTWPTWQEKPDTIKQYGCWLITRLNMFNLYHDENVYDVKQFTAIIQAENGFNYLNRLIENDYNFDEVKAITLGAESYLLNDVVNNIMNVEEEIDDYRGEIEVSHPRHFYAIKTPYANTGHYSLIIGEGNRYFDSYDGEVKTTDDYLKIKRLTFK